MSEVQVQQIKILFSLPGWFTEGEEDEFEADMLLYSFKYGAELINHLCAEGIIVDGGDVDDIPVLKTQLEQVLSVIKWRREGLLEPLRGEEP